MEQLEIKVPVGGVIEIVQEDGMQVVRIRAPGLALTNVMVSPKTSLVEMKKSKYIDSGLPVTMSVDYYPTKDKLEKELIIDTFSRYGFLKSISFQSDTKFTMIYEDTRDALEAYRNLEGRPLDYGRFDITLLQ